MKIRTLLLVVTFAMLVVQCGRENDYFLISGSAVGPLTIDSPIKAVDSLFANDSIVKLNPVKNTLGTQGQVEIYDRDGNKLMLITPGNENDPESRISDILLFDTRYATKEGINPGSTFGELKKQYEIKAVENAINSVIVFLKNSDIWVTIDKNQLPEDIRYNYNSPVEATQIPDEATFKYFRIGWNTEQ